MRKEIETSDFDFEYTGNQFTQKDSVDCGFVQLTGKELQSKISDATIFGDYPMGYKFITDIYAIGKAEGVNNVGSHDFGQWVIDFEKHTLSVKWEANWLDTITHAYDLNGSIAFYDVETGVWRTTFKKFIPWKQE